jgi:hypothetical protein
VILAPAVVALAVAGAWSGALWLVWGSRSWPLVHDAPLMHYVAARLLEGAVPYRDLFDMNFPAVYAAHALLLALLGGSDLAFRAFDLAILAVAAAGLLVALRDTGRWGGPAAAALLVLYHVAGGPWLAGQRDVLLCAGLAWAAAGLAAHAPVAPAGGGLGALGGAAVALGLAGWVKPHGWLLVPLLLRAAWRHRARRRALAVVAAGLAAPAAGALGWLGATGALPAFGDIVLRYLVPLYGPLGREPLPVSLRTRDFGPGVLVALATWAALGALALARARRRETLVLLGAGLAAGGLHFALQGRGWEYHLYPLVLFTCALGGAGLGVASARHCRALAVALSLLLLLAAGTLVVKGGRNREPAWITAKLARVEAVAAALRPVVAAGGTVQVLDTTDGGIHALYRLGARQATRFLYDFHFYHDAGHPYVRRLRGELLAALEREPPAAVVLFERSWPAGGYERLDGFPALRRWLARGYRLAREGDGFRLYQAGPASRAPGA